MVSDEETERDIVEQPDRVSRRHRRRASNELEAISESGPTFGFILSSAWHAKGLTEVLLVKSFEVVVNLPPVIPFDEQILAAAHASWLRAHRVDAEQPTKQKGVSLVGDRIGKAIDRRLENVGRRSAAFRGSDATVVTNNDWELVLRTRE